MRQWEGEKRNTYWKYEWGKKTNTENLKRKKRRDFPSIFTPFFPENQTKINSEKNRDSKEKLENKIGEKRSTRRKTTVQFPTLSLICPGTRQNLTYKKSVSRCERETELISSSKRQKRKRKFPENILSFHFPSYVSWEPNRTLLRKSAWAGERERTHIEKKNPRNTLPLHFLENQTELHSEKVRELVREWNRIHIELANTKEQ